MIEDFKTMQMLLAEIETLKEKAIQSNRLNELIVENSTDAMVSVDHLGVILSWNPAAERIFGFSASEIINKSIYEIISDKSEIKHQLLGQQIAKKNFELMAIRKGGEEFPVELSFSDWQFDGNRNFVFGFRDISERKANDFLIKKLDLAIKNSNDIVLMTNLDGIITYVNPKFTQIYGYQPHEVIGKHTPRILKVSGGSDWFESLWATLKEKKSFKMGHYQNRKKDGSFIDLESTIDPILNDEGEVIGYLGIQHDISSRIKYVAKLEEAIEKEKESDRIKSEFLATMSHELRTPLNAIIGLSGLIDADSPLNEILEYNQIIHKNGEHLLKLIEDLFNISLIESGKVKVYKRHFELANLFDEVYILMKEHQKKLGKTHINFNLKIPDEYKHMRIYADDFKLKHILINLIKNGFKFSENGDVNFGFNVRETAGEEFVTFFVNDTGIGIDQEHYDLIFKGFTQVNNSYNRIYDGIGVGLTIVKKLLKLLDGNIWIESKLGNGSTFFFSFPVVNTECQVIDSHVNNTTLLSDFK
ncbi:PAS domain S-box protein [Mariniflexile sp.]|uniref:sensor histidine kinase n=1 Tax=Mariniflexile sp. TaxID=1979402 RepID=UPI0035666D90